MSWKSLFKKQKSAVSRAMLDEAVEKSRRHILEQRLRAVAALSSVSGADEFQDNPEKMLAVELPFMWGWHHAYAKSAGELPTTPSMRATIQMIEYMMRHHDFDFKRAREEGSSLDSMWNESDPLFNAISGRGEESFSKPNKPVLAQVIQHFLAENGNLI